MLSTWNNASKSNTNSLNTVIVISFSGSLSMTYMQVSNRHQKVVGGSRTSHFRSAVSWCCTASVSLSSPLSTDSFSSLFSLARTQSVFVSRYARARSER